MHRRKTRSFILVAAVVIAAEWAYGSSAATAQPDLSLDPAQACKGRAEFEYAFDFDRFPPLINHQPIPIEPDREMPIGDHQGRVSIQYEGGSPADRQASVVSAPDRARPKLALAFEISRPYGSASTPKGRVQLNLYGHKGAQSIYLRKQIYLHPDLEKLKDFPGTIAWLTLSEWWNNAPWLANATYPFRISLDLVKPDSHKGSPLRFAIKSQTFDQATRRWNKPIWASINQDVHVPIGQWFWLEYRLVEGNAATGRFQATLHESPGAKSSLFDIQNFTHHPDDPAPDGFTEINPIKLYTSASVINFLRGQSSSLRVYWDNVALKGCSLPMNR